MIELTGQLVQKVQFNGVYNAIRKSTSIEPLPDGHLYSSRLIFDLQGKIKQSDKQSRWVERRVQRYIFGKPVSGANFSVEVNVETDSVIIINTLDYCFGHSLDKLFNLQRYLANYPEMGIIVIVHPGWKHLIPVGVAEIWTVDCHFSDLDHQLEGFDAFIKAQLPKYKRVFWGQTRMNLNLDTIEIERFSNVKPRAKEDIFKKSARITFVLREDRFWLRSSFSNFMYKASTKLNLKKICKPYFLFSQKHNVKSLIRKLRRVDPGCKFTLAGLGRSGNFEKSIKDLRCNYETYIDQGFERSRLYADSDMVIGVHGSHMMIPSGLAGSFINLTPSFKIETFGQDFIPKYKTTQHQIFFGRFLPISTPIKDIVKHYLSIKSGMSHL
ncbi:MAG: hypothetical protein R3345_10720 [Fulvivirga sp.]|nr:hypothetical protein [Fulvivirga sp.]